ncbi:uncharacterized protein CLUP02_09493 [Colletotrichum lupini]|uniref:Uncharacterized protein n=1 Tax=Colletotrichum lupini TaxID=145971 RepID=A0A9Q8SUW4_9PEZI|nr:uncharacterized protein CLUP02_09493 [Colletotrichum lupini]UQC83997.1 hypothetical protein CLUP02_09493 [Colletotrichum lupini]
MQPETLESQKQSIGAIFDPGFHDPYSVRKETNGGVHRQLGRNSDHGSAVTLYKFYDVQGEVIKKAETMKYIRYRKLLGESEFQSTSQITAISR